MQFGSGWRAWPWRSLDENGTPWPPSSCVTHSEVMLGDRRPMSHNRDQPSVSWSSVFQGNNYEGSHGLQSWTEVKPHLGGHRGRNRLNGLTLPLCLDSSASWPTHSPTPQPITLHYLCPDELSVGTKNICMFHSCPLKSLFFSDVSQASLLKAKGRRSLSMDILFPSFYVSHYCSGTGFAG